MSQPAARQPWGARLAFLACGAALLGLTWWTTHELDSVLNGNFVLVGFQSLFEGITTIRQANPAWRLRSLRSSIGQVMLGTVAVAGYLAILRSVLQALTLEDTPFLVMLSLSLLALYATSCVLLYMIYISIRNIRVVLRGGKIPHEDRYSLRMKTETKEGGDGCREVPGSPLAR